MKRPGRGYAALLCFMIGTVVAVGERSFTQGTAVPSPWAAQDIGSPAIAGASSYEAATGSFSIDAAGTDIWGTADQFHFVYQPLTGDAVITARIDAVGFAHGWSKAGVMIRSSLSANAAHGFAFASAGKGAGFQRRPSVGGTSLSTVTSTIVPPQWVRLARSGSTVTASLSPDGITWTTVGSQTIALGATAYVGIAVTSHNASQATSADVSAVTAVVPGALPSPQANQDIGSPAIGGSAQFGQGTYTVTAAGNDIWGTADQFHYVYQPVNGDVDVSVKVSSLTDVNQWTKAGVMIRENLTPGSVHAFAGLSTRNNYLFHRRPTVDGLSVNTAGGQGVPPGWVRLKRTGDLFTAYRSTDGTNWTVMSSDSLPMADPVYVGIAVTSHNVAAATTAVLTNLTINQAQGPANQPPTVMLTAPANGASYAAPATVSVKASASDADGTVSRVDFYNGATLLATDTTAPYAMTWSNVAAGTYALKATAVDNAGATASSAVATITVSANQAPTATLTSPANGATFTAPTSIALTASAADANGTVARVDFYNGATLLGSDTTAPYAFTWANVAAGTYALKATAVDNAGATGSSAVATVTVGSANQPPTATLTAPANSATFTAPASITLAANGSDANGTVARVDFYNGTTLLGADTTAPYSFTWGSVGPGTYALKAVAVDNAGASGSSATATVTVSGAATGLVGAYALNAGTGASVSDSSGNGRTGTISGATWAPGRYGQALSFDGSDAVTFGDVDLTGSFTVMGWMQARSLYTNNCGSFVMKAFDYGFEVCSGVLLARVGSGSGWTNTPMLVLTSADLNVWKHVAMTYDGTTVRLYVNGVAVSSTTGTHVSNDNALLFGRWTPAAEYWDGLVDEVRLYSRALSPSEVQTDMNTPVSGGTTNQAPAATLTAPANGATFTAPASMTLTATAADTDGTVARVEFYNGSVLLGTDSTAPYAYTWGSVAAGSYSVRAVAYDNLGASGSSATATVTVTAAANQPPTATLTAPANGATFTAPASMTLTATASDANGTVARVDFYNGSTLLGSDTTAPYSFTWSNVAAGSYSLRATAVDNAGASGSSAVATVTVTGNQAPTATLTAPANGATFAAPASITLTANAADANGTVARVEFYNGSTLLGSDTTAPYAFTWSNVPAGTYALRATAVDNAGATGTSATATITVSAATPPPTAIVFQASSDHASNVTSYLLEIFASGADPNTATPVASSGLGKPTPAGNGDITVDRAAFFSALAPGSYIATVSAVGPGGKTRGASLSFTR